MRAAERDLACHDPMKIRAAALLAEQPTADRTRELFGVGTGLHEQSDRACSFLTERRARGGPVGLPL